MENLGIINWIIVGGIAGVIAKLLMPGRDPGGCLVTILLGVAGALLGGWIGRELGLFPDGQSLVAGLIAAIVGAFVLLLVYRLIAGRRR